MVFPSSKGSLKRWFRGPTDTEALKKHTILISKRVVHKKQGVFPTSPAWPVADTHDCSTGTQLQKESKTKSLAILRLQGT